MANRILFFPYIRSRIKSSKSASDELSASHVSRTSQEQSEVRLDPRSINCLQLQVVRSHFAKARSECEVGLKSESDCTLVLP